MTAFEIQTTCSVEILFGFAVVRLQRFGKADGRRIPVLAGACLIHPSLFLSSSFFDSLVHCLADDSYFLLPF